MNISLEMVVQIIAIISFGAAIINYAVIKPLRDSVDILSKSLNKLDSLLSEVKEKEVMLEQRVTFNEQSIKTAHKRIDNLEKYHQKPIE